MSVNSWTYELINGHPDSPPGSAEVAESFKQHLVPTSVQERVAETFYFPKTFTLEKIETEALQRMIA